jgi:uncharacterized protein (TIGR04255 family)
VTFHISKSDHHLRRPLKHSGRTRNSSPRSVFRFLLARTCRECFSSTTIELSCCKCRRTDFCTIGARPIRGGAYPRFERMLETFERGFNVFSDAIAEENIGPIIPNQCEVSYINQIPVPSGTDLYGAFGKVFAQPTEKMTLDDLGVPKDMRLLLRYVIRDDARTPIGRVIASAEPARRSDGITIIQLTMTARGMPGSSDISGVVAFLERGRLHLIRAFTKLTSPEMHAEWGRS